MTRLFRRWVARAVLSVSIVAATVGASYGQEKVVRIGYQKYGKLVLLKSKGSLEEKLKSVGAKVVWTEFPSGPPLLEALNVGAIDFGNTGEAPPIFAQAAGANIVYAGYEPASPRNEAIIVPKDSPIKTIPDLRKKRVALNKGSNVNYFLVRALEANGLTYQDIEPVYLAPADARAAFERGAVDAWVIWDPYYAAAEIGLGARSIADASGLAANVSFYIASRPIAEENPKVLTTVLTAIDEIDAWIRDNRKQYAAELSPKIGLPADIIERSVNRAELGARRVDSAVLAEQQKIADVFTRLKLIPKAINVFDAEWKTE